MNYARIAHGRSSGSGHKSDRQNTRTRPSGSLSSHNSASVKETRLKMVRTRGDYQLVLTPVTPRTRRKEHREQFPKPRVCVDNSTVMLGAVLLGATCLLAEGVSR